VSHSKSRYLWQSIKLSAWQPFWLCSVCVVDIFFISFGATAPQWARASSFTRFLDHTQRRSTVGRTPLDEWSARRRDLYLSTHNTYNRQTSMPAVGFEPTISAGEVVDITVQLILSAVFMVFKNAVSYFYEQCRLKSFKRDIIRILFWLESDEFIFVKCLRNVWKSKCLARRLLLHSLYTVHRNRTRWIISYFARIVGPGAQPVVKKSLGYKAKNQQVAMSIFNIVLTM
jgi:hypothetical protein